MKERFRRANYYKEAGRFCQRTGRGEPARCGAVGDRFVSDQLREYDYAYLLIPILFLIEGCSDGSNIQEAV
jgi:hypothetical protein